MPAYNFKQQFAEAVELGLKTHTIRLPRKRPTRPGDRLKLYTGQRTWECRLLREVTCTHVTPVRVEHHMVYQNFRPLEWSEMIRLAWRDGFDDPEEMIEFFERLYGLPVELELIAWEVD